MSEPRRIEVLRSRVQQIADALGVPEPVGAVFSIVVRSASRAVEVRDGALAQGVLIGAFRPPSVPDDRSRIRITANTELRQDQVDDACSVLVALLGSAS
jgi:8-amino-7-oxononanoate synthase